MRWLKDNYEKIPNKKFINDLTYEEVYNKTISTSSKLKKVIENMKRVAIYAENSEDTAVFIFSLLLLKKEVVIINNRLAESEIKKQIRDLKIDFILSSDETFFSYKKILQEEEIDLDLHWEFDSEQIAIVLSTGGTTGSPKYVPIKWWIRVNR